MADFDWGNAATPKEGADLEERGRSVMAPRVGAVETFINNASNMVPVGGRVVDTGTALTQKAVQTLDGVADKSPLLDALARYHGGSGAPVRLTPQAEAEIRARGDTGPQAPEAPGLVETYRNARDTRRVRTAAGAEQNPLAAKLGSGAGLLLSMAAPIPSFKGGAEAGLGERLLTAVKNGGAYGMLGGLTEGSADLTKGEVGKAALETLFGGGIGSSLGLGVGGAGELGTKLLSLLKGAYKPAPAAQALIDKGVKDLTLGQMTPGSATAHLEGAATDVPGFGPMLKAQRQQGVKSFQDAVVDQGRAPGLGPYKDGTVAERLSDAYEGFTPAYDAVRANPVVPESPNGPLAQTLPGAADDLSVLADDAQRGAVRKYAQNQVALTEQAPLPMFALPAPGGGGAKPMVTADKLLQARHNIRGQIADALRRQDHPTAQLLQKAEEELTTALEAQMPPDAAASLQTTDAQYAKHKVVQDAVARAGDNPDGFTPTQLGAAIAKATEKGKYARGEGGPLRDLAANGRQVFAEPRGWREASDHGHTRREARRFRAGLAIGNMPGPKTFLTGGYGFQEKLRTLEDAFVQHELAKALQQAGAVRSLGLSAAENALAPPVPAFADEDDEMEKQKILAELARGRR
jgi:hypothetical protein